MYDNSSLNEKLVSELRQIAKDLAIAGYEELRKQELIYQILESNPNKKTAADATASSPAEKTKRKRSVKPVKPIIVLVNFTSISLIYLENTFATP